MREDKAVGAKGKVTKRYLVPVFMHSKWASLAAGCLSFMNYVG